MRHIALTTLSLAVYAGVAAAQQPQMPQPPRYPDTRKGEVVDDFFGTRVPDPFRWLEELDSPETKAWVTAQNAVTTAYLDAIPYRDMLRRRLTELYNYPRVSLPTREGGKLYYRRNPGLARQSALWVRDSLKAAPRLLIDPDKLSPDGSVSFAASAPAPDGRHLAYALAEGGADWQTVHVRDLRTGRDLADTVAWVRFSGITWTKDGKGFFYSRYPAAEGNRLSAALRDQKLYYHALGTPQSADKLIYERTDLPTWFVFGGVGDDGRFVVINIASGTYNNRLYFADLGDPNRPNLAAPVRPIYEKDDAEWRPIGVEGTTLYVLTDLGAPNRRIVAIDLLDPAQAKWRTVVPEGTAAIENASLLPGQIAVQELADVQSRVRFVTLAGRPAGELTLPGIGTVGGFSSRPDVAELFYSFTSPLYPTTVFRYDPKTHVSTPFEAPKPTFDPSRYETKQVFFTSKDGTRVPMFVTHRKGLVLDGNNPTLLYAYGGFGISLTPGFDPTAPAWLEMGGVYATANLRGGSEYGEAWHRAGMLGRKQNVFDDFIGAAEFLIRERYTSPGKLAVQGGSNGGLLVGAVMTQRPELFGVALPEVGVMDMLRYDQFTGGKAWAVEYGSARDSADAFNWLRAYSPLHNIRPGTCYPATMVTTADHDDRVVPSHSFKFTAALQAAQACPKPTLIRVEVAGSHGYRPTDKYIAEAADVLAFMAANLGVAVGSRVP